MRGNMSMRTGFITILTHCVNFVMMGFYLPRRWLWIRKNPEWKNPDVIAPGPPPHVPIVDSETICFIEDNNPWERDFSLIEKIIFWAIGWIWLLTAMMILITPFAVINYFLRG